jgi:hypothetical protein
MNVINLTQDSEAYEKKINTFYIENLKEAYELQRIITGSKSKIIGKIG